LCYQIIHAVPVDFYSAGIDEGDRVVPQQPTLGNRIAGNPGRGVGNGSSFSNEAIKEGGLAHIGPSYDGYHRNLYLGINGFKWW